MEKIYFNYIKLQPIIRLRPCIGLKLEFLGTVQDLADEAMGLAKVERSGRFPSDEQWLQDAAYQIIRQGVDQANNGLDGVKAGIEIALRAFCLARKGEAH